MAEAARAATTGFASKEARVPPDIHPNIPLARKIKPVILQIVLTTTIFNKSLRYRAR